MPDVAFVSPSISITPEMEAFFVAILLDHGTPPTPERYGVDRHLLEVEIAKAMQDHPALPPVILKIKRATYELGGKPRDRVERRDDDWVWFSIKLAAAYLDWLYAAGRLHEQRNMG